MTTHTLYLEPGTTNVIFCECGWAQVHEDEATFGEVHAVWEEHVQRSEKLVVDYQKILKKYIDIVCDNEGVDFLYEWDWTAEEWMALQEVRGR